MSQGQFISNCAADTLSSAAESMKNGALVAFPTETVYGLGADASNEKAVARIYEVKGRPQDHPLILHIASMNDITYWAEDINDYAIALARAFWPGPMTLLLKRSDKAKDFITGNQEIVGLRIPAHSLALNLLAEFKKIGGNGIAAPSANRYGAVSPTTAQAVSAELAEYLQPEDQILDGGSSLVGVESTIIDCSKENPSILRPGAVTAEMVEQSTGIILLEAQEPIVRASGSNKQHYSPKARVLIGKDAQLGDGLIAMDGVLTPDGVNRLASPKNNEEYARILYSALRQGDDAGLGRIYIDPPEGLGLAVAIRDRITRASSS